MTKWGYLYVDVTYIGDAYRPLHANGQLVQGGQGMTLYEYSNWLGKQGWEIVGTISQGSTNVSTVIFKRPLP